MSEPKSPGAKSSKVLSERRIDKPHAPIAAESNSAAAADHPEKKIPATVAAMPETVAQQLRTQAAQLAGHLRSRQRDLDHRDAQINAKIAQVETASRALRLWEQERGEELAEKSADLRKQEQVLKRRLARLAASEAAAMRVAERAAQQKASRQLETERKRAEEALRHERQQIDAHREAAMEMVRRALAGVEKHRAAVEARARCLAEQAARPTAKMLAQQQELDRAMEALLVREHRLEESELALEVLRKETETLRDQLIADRQRAEEDAHAQRRQMADEQRRAMADLEKKRQSLARRSEHVDHCQASLEELRGELDQMHRETLEIRLATEELWVQLSGAAPPASLTRSLSQIRARLADRYRLANDDLARQRRGLETIRDELTRQHDKLAQQKDAVRRWSVQREEEIEAQAARLVAREQELDRQEAEMENEARRWQAERLGYCQEIQRLRAELRRREPATASA